MRDSKSQFFINFNGKKSPIFETIEGDTIYEEPGKMISRKKYKVEDIKIKSKYIPEIQLEQETEPAPIKSIKLDKNEVKGVIEVVKDICDEPKQFILKDRELSNYLFDNVKQQAKALKIYLDKNLDNSEEFFKESYFKLKKYERVFEEAFDEIKYESNKEEIKENQENKKEKEFLDLLDLNPNEPEPKQEKTQDENKSNDEVDFLDINVNPKKTFEPPEQVLLDLTIKNSNVGRHHPKNEIIFENKKIEKEPKITNDAFDFLNDLGELQKTG